MSATLVQTELGELSIQIQWSSPRSTLLKAMLLGQQNLQPAEKDGYNKHIDSTYSTLDSILKAYRAFLDQGILCTQDPQIIGEELVLITELTHAESEEWVRSVLRIKPNSGKNALHELGGAITYLRRYSIPPLTGIAPGDDDDGNHARQDNKQRPDRSEREEELPSREEVTRWMAKAEQIASTRFRTQAEAKAWLKEQEPNPHKAYKRRLKQVLGLLNALPELQVENSPTGDQPDQAEEDPKQRQAFQKRWAILFQGKQLDAPTACWWAGQHFGWVYDDEKGRPSAKATPIPQIKAAVDAMSALSGPQVEQIRQDYAVWLDEQRPTETQTPEVSQDA